MLQKATNATKVQNEVFCSVERYEWDDENPSIQLEPRGERGYIELRSIKKHK